MEPQKERELMTDLKQIKQVLDKAGVVYTEPDVIEAGEGSLILVGAKDGPNNIGYLGFHTELKFNDAGDLETWGCWE